MPQAVAAARAHVLAALDAQRVDTSAVALAVNEAVANAVMHAYRDRPEPGRVRVSVAQIDHAIEVTVCDDGIGLSPRPDSPGAGLGIPLMTSLADHIELDTTAGTRVVLRFALQALPAPPARSTGRFSRDRGAGSRNVERLAEAPLS